MKSEKGVTITSIMIYVVALTIVVLLIGRIITYFYKNVNNVEENTTANAEYLKFNSYFTDEINIEGNEVEVCENNYIIFTITNGIENIIDKRSLTLNIIWNREEGMAVPNEAIKRSEDNKYDYVTLVTGGRYVQIPIKIVSASDSVCIVDNLTSEEKKAIRIETNYVLSLYDVLLIEKK